MIIPDNLTDTAIILKDRYFDLRGLSAYCALAVSTLRDYIRCGKLPCFKVKGKILIKQSEFDEWMETLRVNKKQNIENLVDGVIESLKSN